MKKKIVALSLCVAMLAIAIVGGTLAYFTDTEEKTNVFTVGNIDIELEEEFPANELMPDVKLVKEVTVKNIGDNDAYMWIEVWVPASLDDGDDNSPQAPGLGNSLHFNYDGDTVVETKNTFLGIQYMKKDGESMVVCNANDEGAVAYNGYVHYVKNDTAKKKDVSTSELLNQVYMDKKCAQCEDHNDCMILMDGTTHYAGEWNLHINAVGIQTADNITSITEAITAYYAKDVTAHIW